MSRPDVKKLRVTAKQFRRDILTILTKAGSGHTGGSLSCVEVILAIYSYKLRFDASNPEWKDRDRFVLSKGHGCPTLYVTLAHFGFFPKSELDTLRQLGSPLQGHPQLGLKGIDASTGSLGQGLSIANGMALAARLDKKDTRVYCLMGDGEINEGQIWEAAMSAAHYNLDNICGIIDYNKLQIDGLLCEVMDLGAVKHKWESFGWHAIEVDGHDLGQIFDALDEAEKTKGKPTLIIAHTVKGKGVSFIENKVGWHGIAPKPDELERALKELE